MAISIVCLEKCNFLQTAPTFCKSMDSGSLPQNKVSFGSDQGLKFHMHGRTCQFSGNKTRQTTYQNAQQVVRSPKLDSIAGESGRTMTEDLSPLRRVASTMINSSTSPPVAPFRRLHGSVVCAASRRLETLGQRDAAGESENEKKKMKKIRVPPRMSP